MPKVNPQPIKRQSTHSNYCRLHYNKAPNKTVCLRNGACKTVVESSEARYRATTKILKDDILVSNKPS